MADLNPAIIASIETPGDYQKQRDAHLDSKSRRDLSDVNTQLGRQAVDQGTYDSNARKILDDLIKKHTKLQGTEPAMTPEAVAAQGGNVSQATGQNADGRPSFAPPATEGQPLVTQTTTALPGEVQPGANGLPGPGGVGADGTPIQQISPNAAPQDRPSVGQMMGPVSGETPAQAAPPSAQPQATPPPAEARPFAGQWKTDWDAVQNGLSEAGYGTKALGMNKAISDSRKAAVEGHIKDEELAQKQTERVANILAAIPAVTDPGNATQVAAFNAGIANAYKDIKASGIPISPQLDQEMHQMAVGGYNPQTAQHIQQLAQAATDWSKQHAAYIASAKAKQDELMHGANLEEKKVETEGKKIDNSGKVLNSFQKAREDTASSLMEATTPEEYAAKLAAIDPKLKSQFPATFDPEKTPSIVSRIGMTMEQKLREKEAQKNPTQWKIMLDAAGGDPVKALALDQQRKIDIAKASRAITNLTIGGPGGISPEALDQAADFYHATGQMPNVGFGKDAAAMRLKIMNRAAELHKGADLASNKTDYAANQNAVKDLTKTRSRVLSSEGTTSKNLDLAAGLSKRVDRTGSPAVNRYLLSLKGKYAGDTDTQLLNNAVETAANEYATVVSAGSGGGAAATVSARDHAREMIHSGMSDGTFQSVVKQMKQEMRNRSTTIDEQLKDLRDSRKNPGTPPLPSTLTKDDIGKTFVSRTTGKLIKIKDVNPKDGTQFMSEEVDK